jgi:hypothetical protein
MIHLLQIFRMLNKLDQNQFVAFFNDLSYEIEELGYKGHEAQLINEMLFSHFGFEVECDNQLNRLTESILKNQGRLQHIKNIV